MPHRPPRTPGPPRKGIPVPHPERSGIPVPMSLMVHHRETAQVTNLPSSRVTLDPETGRKALALLQALDDHDDVESTDTNLDITDELLEAVEGASS